jgi:hypothetical protein
MYRISAGRPRLRRGGLGMTSVRVGTGLVFGSSAIPAAVSNIRRPVAVGPARWPGTGRSGVIVGPSYPVLPTRTFPGYTPPTSQWGAQPPRWAGPGSGVWSASNPNNPNNPNNPSSANNLALLTQQYYSNPASLTAQQWQQLQAAGVIPGTVPYSNAGLVNPLSTTPNSAIDPATGIPYAQELAAQQAAVATPASSVFGTDASGNTTIFGLPWYLVAGGAALLFYATSGKRGR